MNKRKRSIAEEPSVSPSREASHNNHNHNRTSPVAPELNEALPAITRRITACAACRKQKVCFFSMALLSNEISDKGYRSDVTCQMANRPVRGVVDVRYLAC